MTHQREDDYWLRGTVGTNYDAIKIPVYALSGHADCWPNTVPRLLENLSVPKRGMQGPWSHRYPHLAIPGPAVGFLQDALRWFDRWLKGLHNGVMDEAVYQVFIQDSVRPKPYYETRPGRWIGEPAWPSPNISQRSYCLNHDGLSDFASSEQTMKICSPNTVGLHGGEYMPWFAFGRADELPDDQRLEDQGSLLFDTTPLSESLVILGDPEVELTLSCDQSVAMLAVRLCDVWPDEASTLITRGLLNLCQRNSKSDPEPLTPGKQYVVKIKLNHVGYTVPRGHKLRLAISTNYWPMAWPCPVAATVAIVTSVSQLKLPLRSNDATIGDITRFEAVQSGQAVKTVQLRDIQLHRSISVDPDTGAHVLEINADNGKVLFEHTKLEMASISLQRYKVKDSDPLSAKAEYRWEWEFARGSDWYVKTLTHTEFTCDRNYFYLTADSIAWENDREVFRKHWEKRFPRDHF